MQREKVFVGVVLALTFTAFFAFNCQKFVPTNSNTAFQTQTQENQSTIILDNGIPKISINNTTLNNMFGVNVYCTGIDAAQSSFLSGMQTTIDNIAKLNIPVMSFDILWSDYDKSTSIPQNAEEAATRFATANLDQILDYAAQKKVFVILQLLIHPHWALPLWWKDVLGNSGGYQLLGETNDDTKTYNEKQTPVAAYNNSVHRQYLKALWQKLISRYKAHPAIVGWGVNVGPTGENGYTPNYIDIMFNSALPQTVMGKSLADYSQTAQQHFRDWLQTKYLTIDKLNQSWSSAYSSFNEVNAPLPIEISQTQTFAQNGDSRPEMIDWQNFRFYALLDEWSYLTSLARELDPNKIVVGKTSWNPMTLQIGTQFMQDSAIEINQSGLIDVDMNCGGITLKDYQTEFLSGASGSLIDYTHFIRFSNIFKKVRIYSLENWVRVGSPSTTLTAERAIKAKDTIKNEGGYMWFTVALPSDFNNKPSWTWKEIEALVTQSTTTELTNITTPKNDILFFYDRLNRFTHYQESFDQVRSERLSRSFAFAFYKLSTPLTYSFIFPQQINEDYLTNNNIKLLLIANQRELTADIIAKLQAYLTNGGAIVLIGSNGIFAGSTKSTTAIKTLIPDITADQINELYSWGTAAEVSIPYLVLNKNGYQYAKFLLSQNPFTNYQQLQQKLQGIYSIPDGGILDFSSMAPPEE